MHCASVASVHTLEACGGDMLNDGVCVCDVVFLVAPLTHRALLVPVFLLAPSNACQVNRCRNKIAGHTMPVVVAW
jgi:hypothetical protein